MLLAEFIRESTHALEALYPAAEAGNMALLLCCERLGVKSYTHIVDPSYEVDDGPLGKDLERLLTGEPLQYVLGSAWFCGRRFKVGPGVLIPRPETEQLVELASGRLSGMKAAGNRVLDLCTGSGCIAWTLALDHPGLDVTGVDISPEALALAESQPFGPSPVFLQADLLGEVPELGVFDLIVSNPPYVMESEKSCMRKNVLDFEPPLALFVPDSDPLVFYRAVARWAGSLLCPGGCGIVEINEAFGPETMASFASDGFVNLQCVHDIYGKNRFVIFEKTAFQGRP